jgi:hypothetical protein
MDISYTFRFSDYAALATAMRSHRRRRIQQFAVWFLVLVNFGLGLHLLQPGGEGPLQWRSASFNFGIGLAVLLFFAAAIPWLLRYNYKRTGLDGQTIRVRLEDDAFTASQRGAQSRIEWSAIVRHSQLPTHAFLWLNKMQGAIIPFDAFADTKSRDAFLAFINSKVPLSA